MGYTNLNERQQSVSLPFSIIHRAFHSSYAVNVSTEYFKRHAAIGLNGIHINQIRYAHYPFAVEEHAFFVFPVISANVFVFFLETVFPRYDGKGNIPFT